MANLIREEVTDIPVERWLPHCNAEVLSNGASIHTNLQYHILYEKNDDLCKEHMKNKYEWNKECMEDINWEAHKQAIKKMDTGKQ